MAQHLYRALTYVSSFLDWPISIATSSCRRYRQQHQQDVTSHADDSTEQLLIPSIRRNPEADPDVHQLQLIVSSESQRESRSCSDDILSDSDSDSDEFVDAREFFCGARGQLIIPTPVHFDSFRFANNHTRSAPKCGSGCATTCGKCYVIKTGDRRSLNMDLSGECGCFPLPFHSLKVSYFIKVSFTQ